MSEAWHHCIATLRAAITAWLAKGSKHAAVAIPLQAQLLCLSNDDVFLKDVGGVTDNLQKQLRVAPTFRSSAWGAAGTRPQRERLRGRPGIAVRACLLAATADVT